MQKDPVDSDAQLRRELTDAGYTALKRIGKGGFHQVWAAGKVLSDLGEQTLCALKIYVPQDESEELRRLRREHLIKEAKILIHLNRVVKTHLVPIQNYFQTPQLLCLEMEYLEGFDLGQLLIHRARPREALSQRCVGPLPEEVALTLVAQAARGLGEAHNARDKQQQPLGLMHLDIKPGNLFLDRSGTLKVIDFGIARAGGASPSDAILLGTPQYMAPEQIQGNPQQVSDFYSLGCVLFELLTLCPLVARVPGEAGAATAERAFRLSPGPILERLPPALERSRQLLQVLLQSNPAARQVNGSGLARFILDELLGGRPADLSQFYLDERARMEAFRDAELLNQGIAELQQTFVTTLTQGQGSSNHAVDHKQASPLPLPASAPPAEPSPAPVSPPSPPRLQWMPLLLGLLLGVAALSWLLPERPAPGTPTPASPESSTVHPERSSPAVASPSTSETAVSSPAPAGGRGLKPPAAQQVRTPSPNPSARVPQAGRSPTPSSARGGQPPKPALQKEEVAQVEGPPGIFIINLDPAPKDTKIRCAGQPAKMLSRLKWELPIGSCRVESTLDDGTRFSQDVQVRPGGRCVLSTDPSHRTLITCK